MVLAGAAGFVDCAVEAALCVLPFAGPAQPVATRAMIANSPRMPGPRSPLDVLGVFIFGGPRALQANGPSPEPGGDPGDPSSSAVETRRLRQGREAP